MHIESREARARVHSIAKGYLEEHAPEKLPELAVVFDSTYDVVIGELEDDGGIISDDPELGLAFDSFWFDGTIVGTTVFLATYLSHQRLQGPTQFESMMESLRKAIREQPNEDALRQVDRIESLVLKEWREVPWAPFPDLRLLVETQMEQGQMVLRFRADDQRKRQSYIEFGAKRLFRPPAVYFQTVLSDVESIADGDLSNEAAEWKLAASCSKLFRDLLPEKLQERFWVLRESPASLQILSEDTAIPWELIKIREPGDGSRRDGPFWAESFALTRWLPGEGEVHELPLRKLGAILVTTADLPNPETEIEMLRELGYSVTEIPARYEAVIEALRSGEYDGFHFIGHGKAQSEDADRSYVELNDYHKLKPGEIPDLRSTRPFIFWNACQTAQGGLSLAGAGGWAKAFLKAGAGAFVGALWSIRSSKARSFAEKLYGHFRADTPFGEAVRQARREMKGEFPGDPSWLAYAVFGHPEATRAD